MTSRFLLLVSVLILSCQVYPRTRAAASTIHTVDKLIHARKRRVLNSAFSENALRSSEEFMIKHVDRWNELTWEGTAPDTWSTPKNIALWVDYLVFDILGELCFGRSFETKEPGENNLKGIPHGMTMFLKFMYPVSDWILSTIIE
jgi:hypothetical protein